MKLVMFSANQANQSDAKRGHTVVVDDVRAVVPLAGGVKANLAADSLYYVVSDGNAPLSALVVPNIGEPALLSINPLGVPVFSKPVIGHGYDLAEKLGLNVIDGRDYSLEFALSANGHKVIPIGGSDARKTEAGFVLSAPTGGRRAGCLVVSSEGVLQINAEWIDTIVVEVNQLYNNEGGAQHANNQIKKRGPAYAEDN